MTQIKTITMRISPRNKGSIAAKLSESKIEPHKVICEQNIYSDKRCKLVFRRLPGMEEALRQKKFPTKTHLDCWYDGKPHDNQPIPIVQGYNSVTNEYDVFGLCCSASCAKSFITAGKTNDCSIRLMWQTQMMIDYFGWPRDEPILQANPLEEMESRGGYKTLEQWRIVKKDIKVQVVKPPFIPYSVLTRTRIEGTFEQIENELNIESSNQDKESLQDQAEQHGTTFVLKGLKRPAEDECIKTIDQLKAKYPNYKVVDESKDSDSVFQNFLDKNELPTDEECENIRNAQNEKRQASRKKNKTMNDRINKRTSNFKTKEMVSKRTKRSTKK